MWMSLENNETEPIGSRIIEMPANNELVELRDYHAEGSLVACVPPGSVKKGETLANSGSKATRCSVCHGSDLQGMGPVPGIAGTIAELHCAPVARHGGGYPQTDDG